MTNLTPSQLKTLITDHSVRENLESLLKQAQTIVELASKLCQETNKLMDGKIETLNQTQLLEDLEQLRLAKHYMRGIRFVNFYQVLKGETSRHTTTEKFEVEKWLKQQVEKEKRWKEKLAAEKAIKDKEKK